MRWRRLILFVLIGLGVLAIALPLAMWAYGSRLLRRERAACRKAGMSMTVAELLPDEPVADEENAAIVYEQAIALMGRTGDWPERIQQDWSLAKSALRQARWTAEESAATEKAVAHFRKVSDLLVRARMRPKCRFNQTLSPATAPRPSARGMVTLGHLEGLRAHLAATAGRRQEALEATESVLALAEALKGEPTPLLVMLRGALVGQGRRPLAAILESGPLSATERSRLLALLPEGVEVREHMQRAINAEMILVGGEVFRRLRNNNRLGGIILNFDEAYYRRKMRETWLRAAEPAYRRPAARDDPPPRYYLGSTLATPGTAGVHLKAMDRPVVSADLARIALSLDRHRQAWGKFPAALGELSLEQGHAPLREDPFSGKAYGYRRTDGGWRLWSAGQNGRDDDGSPEGDDIVLEFPPGASVAKSAEPSASRPEAGREWNAYYWQERARKARQHAPRDAGK